MPTSSLRSAAVARENREGGVITVPGPHLTWPTQTVTRRGCERLDQPGLTTPTSVVERRAGHVRHGGPVVYRRGLALCFGVNREPHGDRATWRRARAASCPRRSARPRRR